jgi:hypothetical protein
MKRFSVQISEVIDGETRMIPETRSVRGVSSDACMAEARKMCASKSRRVRSASFTTDGKISIVIEPVPKAPPIAPISESKFRKRGSHE